MSAAHTPGPPNYRTIADINKAREPDHEANARLIAAAPELLNALADLVELADTAMHAANRDGGEYDRVAELADARAAIAKATGSEE